MKILAIIGSLRKKNTYEAVKKVEALHKSRTDCEYEYLFLKDMDFKLCTGCHVCITLGEDKCPLKDDRDLIIRKIEAADGVILASANYVMNVNWLTKNYIDRFAYTMHRPKYFRQKFMILITSGSYMGARSALQSLSIISSGGRIASKFFVCNSPGMNENKIRKQERKLEKGGMAFIKSMDRKVDTNPSFGYLIWFCVFKAASETCKDHLPADYAHFKDRNYFIDIELPLPKRIVVSVLTGFFRFLVKRGVI